MKNLTKDFFLFLSCSNAEWEAYNDRLPMTKSLFMSISERLCELELYGLLGDFINKYPSFSALLVKQTSNELYSLFSDYQLLPNPPTKFKS